MKSIILGTIFFVSISLAILSGEVTAGITEKTFSLTPQAGWYIFDKDQDMKNGSALGLGLGYDYTRHFGVEAVYDYIDSEEDVSGDNATGHLFRVDALYHFMPEKTLVPYVAAGLGVIDISDVKNKEYTEGLFNYGGGIKYFLTKSLAVRGDLRHIVDLNDFTDNMIITAGLSFLFGKEEKAAIVKSPAAVIGPVDSDKDGVTDELDNCPGTPAGVSVDGRGCPMDSDGDGVYDYIDKCPDTQQGIRVDTSGCPVDSDRDGVTDDLDKCPGTPVGIKVDTKGCPVDSDRDGVTDDLDKCPGTPQGIRVDERGCPVPIKEKVSIDLNIEFDTGKAVVKNMYHEQIQKVVDFLNAYPGTTAVIEGHTDNSGNADNNLNLSQKRAENVAKHITDAGISPDRIRAVGYGETQPIADNNTKEGRQRNRRVVAAISTIVTK